jgi:2-polyprenyl-3-methyl-5-hydroxy-6-metoxy-1,4-benzoquinol methylase
MHGETLHKTLQSLAWINKWFGNHRSVVNAIISIDKKGKQPLSIIDLGCGGGDLLLAVAKALQKNNIQFTMTGIDGNINTLRYAQKKCAGFPEINFVQADILVPDFSLQPCDILISSHFMYHFAGDVLVDFLKNNIGVISTVFIISELKRSRLAMFLFKISSIMLPISNIAKEDGLMAIKRSFTKKEWISILQQAGIVSYNLQSVPLFRILLNIDTMKKI